MNKKNNQHIPLSGAYNFRDLGGYRTHSNSTTKWRRIIRADSPHRLSGQDINILLDTGLTTVIDLRSKNEVESSTNPFAADERVQYQNIGLFDHLAPDSIRESQSPDASDPLLDFYTTTLADRQEAIRNVLHAIATAADGMVMFHCTAGKDRTGLISALILGLADVERSEIIADYAQTKVLIEKMVGEFLTLAKENGTDLTHYRRLLACNPETMGKVLNHIEERYRSISDFVSEVKLDAAAKEQLRTRLLA